MLKTGKVMFLLMFLQAAERNSSGRYLRSQVVVDADIAKVISKVGAA